MMLLARATIAALLLLGASAIGSTSSDATVAAVKRAVDHIRQHGSARALADITAGDIRLFDAERHQLVVYGLDGRCLAHSANPRQVGRELLDLPDVEGRFLMRERIALLRSQPDGVWQDYRTLNPASKKIEPRRMYCERLGDSAVCGSALR